MSILTTEERETCFLICAANRQTIHVFSDDRVWQNKLERAGAKLIKTHASGSKEYEIAYRQLSLRKAGSTRQMSDAQRQAAAARLRAMRLKKENHHETD